LQALDNKHFEHKLSKLMQYAQFTVEYAMGIEMKLMKLVWA